MNRLSFFRQQFFRLIAGRARRQVRPSGERSADGSRPLAPDIRRSALGLPTQGGTFRSR